jgi:hypothetical protein
MCTGLFPRVKTLRDIRAARVGRTRRRIGNATQLCEAVHRLNTIEFLDEAAFGPSQARSRVTPKGLGADAPVGAKSVNRKLSFQRARDF